MATDQDERWMAEALSLGMQELGATWPNPAVGCIIVKEGQVVGRGWTQKTGRPHAEAVALAEAGPAAEGATAYVTLEPCSHHGKTSPCAEALIAAKVARVVVATEDPDPRVSGRGLSILREAGVDVAVGVLEREARASNAGFLKRIEAGRPFVTLKLATALDGRIATASGESQWITGPEARKEVHAMRARHDAVMVGGGTVRADNPSLTVRGVGEPKAPIRIIVSAALDIAEDGNLARSAHHPPVWLFHGPDCSRERCDAWTSRGARLFQAELSGDQLDMGAIIAALARSGITRIFCEGGGAIAASLLRAACVDEIVYFTAGLFLGSEARPGIGILGIKDLASTQRFRLKEFRQVGRDLMHIWETE
ncbi:bifunctional diaminohydroxyphosphoribosylaminopyrimidine deaminase/5-amino-6-(5-phosphoribosylamino)uracil reductase RibD [Rhizobium sp. FKY42]|uniref:bifunctional diaminohydroxyphosphoribosylaminopyrimidine deaminase/5-amino-6-(5-phosphoribosylamino)uracil reductase RibD n=1 Tax=Rhizobium sp. FKY42 TaxID=2562310 RepID=UPI0010C05569|nr:bifunctional diaminohydroxyphosphoribosylaminopyrimidine deaminase/5-amino-6-(5-phosphoribosylamino)uracil reductase RibD [Rhizobium sp. FKY42]